MAVRIDKSRDAMNVGGITLDTSVLDRITAEMRPKASRIVNKWGLKVASDWARGVPVDTAAYRNSILSESKMIDVLAYRTQDGVEYGVWVELGTYKMAARPALIPAVENNTEPFLKDFESLFK